VASLRRAWENLPIGRKAAVAVVLPIVALLAGFLALHLLARADRAARDELDRHVQIVVHLRTLDREVLRAETSVRGVSLTGDESLLAPAYAARENAAAALRELEAFAGGDLLQELELAQLRDDVAHRFATMELLREAGAGAPVAALIISGHGMTTALQAELHRLEDREFRKRGEQLTRLERGRQLTLAVNGAILLLAVAGALGGVSLLNRSLVKRVQLTRDSADRMARELPLTYFASGRDEISQLARRLQYTSGLLTSRTAALRETARRLQAEIALRAKAEKARRESETRFQAILDYTSAVIYVKDLAGRFQRVNRQFEMLFKISREEARGHTASELFGAAVGEPLRQHDDEVIRRAIPLEFEETVSKGSSERVYLSMKFPLLDAGGQPHGICGISTDVTAQKAAEKLLRAGNNELEARVKERTVELERRNARLRQEITQYLQASRTAGAAAAPSPPLQ
jgi:PAS domain S-box-containing protein